MFADLIKHLHANKLFKPAFKKIKKYKPTTDLQDTAINTFYVHQGKRQSVTTSIGHEKETRAPVHQGDYVITGPLHEKYIVKSANLHKFYNLVDGYLYKIGRAHV